MSVDKETVRRVARLARMGVDEDQLEPMTRELNTILAWIEELGTVDTSKVAPMTSVVEVSLPRRLDEVTDGARADDVLKNAPERIDGFFAVPKVVE